MALLPPFFLDSVVAIGIGDNSADRQWVGTGFLFGKVVDDKIEMKDRTYHLWLITNKHVLEDFKKVYIKFNGTEEECSKDYPVTLVARNGKPQWIGHKNPNIDVAVIKISPSVLKKDNRDYFFFQSDSHIMKKHEMKTKKITEGDKVYVLGFPMGLVSQDRSYVICRSGCIARIRNFLENKCLTVLIDATVFPGNSGGPVIICPSSVSIQGTNTIDKADLIGIVKSYVPYQDAAISQQTKRPRIIFEENSGLTLMESVDSIIETIKLAEKRIEGRIAVRKSRMKKATPE